MSFNLALLGGGLFAGNAYLPALAKELNKPINVHTLWSRSEKSVTTLSEKAKELGFSPQVLFGEDGFDKILSNDEIDAVSLVLPITAQPELILKALKAGKHVLSEKPVGKDVETAKKLIEEYETVYKPKGLIWRVAENWENDTILLKARDILREDKSLGPILYWQYKTEGVVADGSSYQATQWRTIPDYQGGFLLDGGVHYAAGLRTVLPDYARPTTIISTASLHRAHLPPHDTIQAIALPSKQSSTDAHGPTTALQALTKVEDIPGGIGKSSPNGSILFTVALPDTPPESRTPNGLTVTTLNAVVSVLQDGRTWKLKVTPANGSDVKAREESGEADGVPNELEAFRKTVQAAKEGKQAAEHNRGDPRGPLWDVALIQALLTSNGTPVELEKLLA